MSSHRDGDADGASDETTARARFDRREYLKLAGGSTVAAAGFPLVSGQAVAATSHHGISFDRVLDAVDDLGMDPNGDEPIDGQLDFRNGTLIEFPPGEYLVQDKQYENGLHRWGIRGTGGSRSDVRFVPPDGNTQRLFQINGFDFRDDCTDILVENVTFDQSATTGTAASNQFYVQDGLEIHDVETYGQNPNGHQANGPEGSEVSGLYLMVYDAGGTAVVENYAYVGETTVVDYPDNASGISVYRDHAGTLYVRDCNIENRGEHAIYASKVSGGIRVEGGTFKNNVNTNMRISGSGSYVEDATIGIDRERSYFVEDDTGEEKSGRGMWWEAGDIGKTGGYIENCDFVLDTNLDTPGLIRVEGTTGAMEIRDCRIRNDSDESTNTVFVQQIGQGPGGATPPTPHDVEITNCSFTGSSPSPAVESNRTSASVTVSNSCEEMPNGGGFEGSLSTNDISNGGCPVPGSGSGGGGGGGGGGDAPGPMNDITFSGGNVDTFDYYFRATDDVQGKNGIGGEDEVGDDTADGSTTGTGSDTYLFEQDVAGMSLDLGGYMMVNVDRSERTITIEGVDDGYNNGYYLEVTGDLYRTDHSDDHDVDASPNGDSVNGLVGSGTDEWEYSGELSRIGLNQGTATVDVTRRHKLEIEDYQDGVTADYEFSVSGSLEKGRKANDSDDLSGTTADGQVTNGTDSYVFTGRITDWNNAGAVHTYIDDREVITPSLDDNTVTIEGDGTSHEYLIEVVGGLGKSAQNDASIDTGDVVSARTAEGTVTTGNDSYDYRNGVRVDPRNWDGAAHYFESN